MKMCIIEKKNPWRKKFKLIFSGNVKKNLDTLQCLINFVDYLNTKMKDILVEIIDLKICSSLK